MGGVGEMGPRGGINGTGSMSGAIGGQATLGVGALLSTKMIKLNQKTVVA